MSQNIIKYSFKLLSSCNWLVLIDLRSTTALAGLQKNFFYHSNGQGLFKLPTCQATIRLHLSAGPFPSNLTHSGPFDPELIKRVPQVPTRAARNPSIKGYMHCFLYPLSKPGRVEILVFHLLLKCAVSSTGNCLSCLFLLVSPLYFSNSSQMFTTLSSYFRLQLPNEFVVPSFMLSP